MTHPQAFHGFIGQRRAVKSLKRQIQGSLRLGRALSNILLYGQPGTGKTELGRAIAVESGAEINCVVAAKETDIPGIISRVRSHDILFIDEAHALSPQSQEFLYGRMDAVSGVVQGDNSLPVFTTILATDQPNRLTKALRSRCSITILMEPYSIEEIRLIIQRFASKEMLLLTPQAVTLLAEASQGIPRNARNMIRNLAGYGTDDDQIRIDEPGVRRFLDDQGFDEFHRDPAQRLYMKEIMHGGGCISVEWIARLMGIPSEFIIDAIEPFLVRSGWVDITPKGRRLTIAGANSLGNTGQSDAKSTRRGINECDQLAAPPTASVDNDIPSAGASAAGAEIGTNELPVDSSMSPGFTSTK